MQDEKGFVKVFRKFKKWGWYQDTVVKAVFLHCLLSASYGGFEWMGKKYNPGQFITSIDRLSKDLKLSPKQVRNAIEKLCKSNEIGKQATNKFTVITVIKWEDYQTYDTECGNQRANKWQTEDNQATNEGQQYKNIKNKKNIKNNVVANSAYPNVLNLADLYR